MGATYRKGLLLSLGSVIQTQVDLYTVIPSNSGKPGMNRLCPDHKIKLTQAHHCDGNGNPEEAHYVTEFILGRVTSTETIIPDENEKPDLPATDVLELSPVPASELDDNTIPGKSRFYLAPTHSGATEPWQVIYNLAEKGKIALVAKGSLRQGSYEKLWRIETFRQTLVLTEITYPDVINDPPEVEHVKVSRQISGLVTEFVDGLMTSWEKIDTTNVGQARMEEWLNAAQVINVQVTDTNVGAAHSLIEALKEATKN